MKISEELLQAHLTGLSLSSFILKQDFEEQDQSTEPPPISLGLVISFAYKLGCIIISRV
jgi:hypothetical protein